MKQKTYLLIFVSLLLSIMLWCVAACDMLVPDVEVNSGCPEYKDCLMTVEEGKAMFACIADGTTTEVCVMRYVLEPVE